MLIKVLEKIRNKLVPSLNYRFGIESFDFFIQTPNIISFDISNLNSEDYKYIYSKIFSECIKNMNLKNQKLITHYFSTFEQKNDYRENFINNILTEYINNLSAKQKKDLADTGIVASYFRCTTTNNYQLSINTLCIGNIKIFISDNDYNIKINWNKISTISSLVPLMLIVNTYEYFNVQG